MYEANCSWFRKKREEEKIESLIPVFLDWWCDERRRLWILRLSFLWWTSYPFPSSATASNSNFFPLLLQILRDHEEFVVIDESSLELRRWAWWWWFFRISESFFLFLANSFGFCEIDAEFCVVWCVWFDYGLNLMRIDEFGDNWIRLGFLDDEVLDELQCVLHFFLRLICFGRREKRDCVSDFLCDVATILWLCDDLAPFIDWHLDRLGQ